ncbi:hypothetical protein QJU83_02315 [Pasteurella skyensis]|uniref:hypothetical protein n=1 Tax=Phocoenobacter skyensis TaxID=97481 RepID=UPI002745E026|nr:hypothetical protein [Pasteurella skyensis]MDP8176377.1 hypothetical protein [Pasteurella skyensis]MDP8199110.1 hypothetical protein [Pasteurella skyensis]
METKRTCKICSGDLERSELFPYNYTCPTCLVDYSVPANEENKGEIKMNKDELIQIIRDEIANHKKEKQQQAAAVEKIVAEKLEEAQRTQERQVRSKLLDDYGYDNYLKTNQNQEFSSGPVEYLQKDDHQSENKVEKCEHSGLGKYGEKILNRQWSQIETLLNQIEYSYRAYYRDNHQTCSLLPLAPLSVPEIHHLRTVTKDLHRTLEDLALKHGFLNIVRRFYPTSQASYEVNRVCLINFVFENLLIVETLIQLYKKQKTLLERSRLKKSNLAVSGRK